MKTPRNVSDAAAAVHVADYAPASSPVLALAVKCVSFPVFLGALLVGAVFCSSRLGLQDPDTWWHVQTGNLILATHHWPATDPFSFTVAGKPWLPYEWLGDVIMALCARIAGLQGLTFGVMFFASILFILVYYYAFLRCGNAKAAFLACAALLPLTVVFFTFRPQLIGDVFLALTLVLLERYRQGLQKSLWALPLVFLLWVNTHGSFTFGLLALGLYVACGLVEFHAGDLESSRWRPEQLRHLLVISVLSAMALAITPYGLRVAINPIQMALSQPVNIASITEWQSMPFGIWRGKLFLALVLSFVLGQPLLRMRYRLPELLLFLFGVYSACVHARFLVIFIVIFAPLLATLLARWVPQYEPKQDHPVLNAVLISAICASFIFFFPAARELQQTTDQFFPEAAIQFLSAHPVQGPMLNEYTWGGYLAWRSAGERKVFIDGRADIYESAGVLPDYMHIIHLEPDAPSLLQKYNIQSCLIGRDAPLATMLSAMPGWSRVYEDSISALFIRRDATVVPSASNDLWNSGQNSIWALE